MNLNKYLLKKTLKTNLKEIYSDYIKATFSFLAIALCVQC